MTPEEPREVLEARRAAFAAELAAWQNVHEAAAPYLSPTEELTFRRTVMRAKIEIAWHDKLMRKLPAG